MNLTDFVKRLDKLVKQRPDLAKHEIIVRNVQEYEMDADFPEEENAKPPYWLGSIAGIGIDKYISTEDGTWFRSDHDRKSAEELADVIIKIQRSYCYEGDERDPEELPDEEVMKMWVTLPWKEAIVADIGVAW